MAGGSIMIIGTIILGSSYTTAQFLVGRIVTGLGNGINSSTVPAYQSELARPELHGMLLSAYGTVTILGLCIAYWLDYGLSFVDTPVQWRFPISFQAFFAVFLVLQMTPLPDSPSWLYEQDRSDEAASVLARLQMDQPANMFSAAGFCFCFVMTAILLSIGTTSCAYAATVFVIIFQLFLGIGYLPVPWWVIYPSCL